MKNGIFKKNVKSLQFSMLQGSLNPNITFPGLEISGCTGARCTQKFGCAPKFLKLGARRAPSNFNTVIVDCAYNKKHLKLNVFKTLSIHDFQPTPIRFKSVYL